MAALSQSQLESRASRIVGYTSDAAKKTNIDKGYVSSGSSASKKPVINDATTAVDSQKIDPVSPQKVDTSQPSPTTVQAGAGLPGGPQAPTQALAPDTVGFDVKTGQPLAPGATTKDALGNTFTQGQKFRQGLAQANASGIQPGATAGASAGMIQATTGGPTQEVPSPLTGIVDVDKNFDNIFTQFDDFYSPVKQKQTLLQEYKGLEKSLGINKLNEDLLNAERIIDGTEDDIRSEVQAVSGFATDSQVLALANARNKSLVKNYNYLLESRNNAMTQLNTMMNLSIQDRQMAEKEFDTKMNFAFKVAEFKEKAVSNATEAYNNVIKAVGYDGLYKSLQADPSSISVVEKTLGLAPGQLSTLASQPKPKDLQFVSGTDNQASGYFDKSTGTFTKLGVGGGGKGGVDDGKPSPYQQEKVLRTIQSVDELFISANDNPGIFGRTAALPLPDFLRTDAYRNFKAELNTLKANIAFGELQEMRNASKTGGALGSVAVQELNLLESALGALNMSQSPENFKTQLTKIKTSLNRWNQAQMGQSGGQSQQPTITAPDGTQVIIID